MNLSPEQLNALFGTVRAQGAKLAEFQQLIGQMQGLMKAQADTPKYIEDIPGRRVPYVAPINLTVAASSTSTVEGTHNVTTDGPFICTAIAAFFRKTSGAYQGWYGSASSVDARIGAGTTGQQHGGGYIFDHPALISGDFEIVDRGSDRFWQHQAFSSALLHPKVGGAYVMPVTNLFGKNSTVLVRFTPQVSLTDSGVLQVLLLGYKIVQGDNYQP